MTVHVLKCDEEYFIDVQTGNKPFELRKDDRDPPFETGDVVVLVRGPGVGYGETLIRRIGYIARGGRIPKGYCVFALKPGVEGDHFRAEMAMGRTPVSK